MNAAVALLAATLGAAAPPEDVGVVFRSTSGSAGLVAACPRVAVVETGIGAGELIRTLLASCAGSEAVFQLPAAAETPFATTVDDARFRAATYWSVVAPAALSPLAIATPPERAAIWLAGPASFDSTPSWRDDPACDALALSCAADYVGAFWAELDRLARADGFRGLVLPPFSQRPGDRPRALCDLLDGLDLSGGTEVAWTYDAVSPGLARSAAEELTTTFGYRGLRSGCASARAHPLLVRVSTAAGWQAHTTATGFVEWLRFVDQEVDADADPFLGLALYGFGTGDASDLRPFEAQLAAFLVDPATPGGGSGGDNGGTAPPATPPTEPGSSLGPDRGASLGCSTAGAGSLALLGLMPLLVRARRGPRASAMADAVPR